MRKLVTVEDALEKSRVKPISSKHFIDKYFVRMNFLAANGDNWVLMYRPSDSPPSPWADEYAHPGGFVIVKFGNVRRYLNLDILTAAGVLHDLQVGGGLPDGA